MEKEGIFISRCKGSVLHEVKLDKTKRSKVREGEEICIGITETVKDKKQKRRYIEVSTLYEQSLQELR